MKPDEWNITASAGTDPQQFIAFKGEGYCLSYEDAKLVAERANGYPALAAELAKLREDYQECVAALEAFDSGFADSSIKWAKPRQSDRDPYHPANILMCAALSKAKGRAG